MKKGSYLYQTKFSSLNLTIADIPKKWQALAGKNFFDSARSTTLP
ncbi:hypothetical protein CWATWH0402_3761 [Crocosphaera watsonii WH 0402]|uniref:Uncharacterized protein n=2 Tax=Crocosphaera watsonii TaxID=263511 RepID=T2JTF9_CROWT|nr:hypothetical protein CWATWH0401_4624 [Crocosphaera watsonii WH 0401]CCQ69133.1 hypothetical protein CWATWH0402_3761 [Crocosphaera watsonii WH 0402]